MNRQDIIPIVWSTILDSFVDKPQNINEAPFFMMIDENWSSWDWREVEKFQVSGKVLSGHLEGNETIYPNGSDNRSSWYDKCRFEEAIQFGKRIKWAETNDMCTIVLRKDNSDAWNWPYHLYFCMELLDISIDKEKLSSLLKSKFELDYTIKTIKKRLHDGFISLVSDIITKVEDKMERKARVLTSVNSVSSSSTISTSLSFNSQNNKAYKTNTKLTTMNTPQIDKSKIEYVVGIDLGHGETSAALCPIQWDEPESNWTDPTDIEMENNRKVLASAITILPDGKAFIGEKAFNPDILKKADAHVCFKQRPADIDGNAEKLMIRYMSEVYKLILENTNGILTKDNHVVYIATPSGWDNEAKNLYFEMAKKAGMPIAGVTKESRAAFVKGMKDPITGLSRNARKGAIVFDMGSSTLDFTYLSDNNAPIDFGYDCGASQIEKILYAKKKAEGKVNQFEEKYPTLIACLLFAARTVKEDIYFKKGQKVRKTIHLDELVEDDDLDETVKFVFEPGQLNELLKEEGYVGTIEKAMQDFVAKHINNAPIYGVFLTGGASRMDFIEELVMKCFGVEKRQISHDQDPSLTISEGVAEVARMDLHTSGADEDLSEVIDEIINKNSVYNAFVETFSFDLYDSLTDEMAAIANCFKDSEEDYSLNDLSNAFESQVENTVQEFLPKASAYVSSALEEQTKDLVERIESMVAVYTQQGVEVKMPELNINININLQPVAIRRIVDSISQELAKSIKNNVRNWLTGAGAIFGLIGMAAGWLIGSLFNDSEEEKLEKAMNKELDAEKRAEVYDSLSEEWEKITGEIREEIYNAVKGNQQIKNSITKAVSSLLNQYKHELEQARMLID